MALKLPIHHQCSRGRYIQNYPCLHNLYRPTLFGFEPYNSLSLESYETDCDLVSSAFFRKFPAITLRLIDKLNNELRTQHRDRTIMIVQVINAIHEEFQINYPPKSFVPLEKHRDCPSSNQVQSCIHNLYKPEFFRQDSPKIYNSCSSFEISGTCHEIKAEFLQEHPTIVKQLEEELLIEAMIGLRVRTPMKIRLDELLEEERIEKTVFI